jgi:transportin-3
MVVMASNGSSQQAFAPVLAAMATMRDGQREQKKAAHVFLESFQKSVRPWWGYCSMGKWLIIIQSEAWQITIGLLQSDADAEAKLFAATTLKGKVVLRMFFGVYFD